MSPRLEARNLSKKFGSFAAVANVTLDFAPGEIHAVLGENGAGKSTLMKLLFGLHAPTEGEIFLNGKAVSWRDPMDAIHNGLGMVQQHFTLVETLSSIDNIILGAEICGKFGVLRREDAIAKLEKSLPSPHLAVPWHARVSELTVGQKQRVEILKLLYRDSKILFLDEPTAVLSPLEIDDFFSVLRQLKASGRTIVLITHKINEVLEVCDTFSILRGGMLQIRGKVKGASVEQIVESMIGRKIPEFSLERKPVGQKQVIVGRSLSDEGRRLKEIALHVNAGEIVGVAGVEGSGQGQLVDILMGLIKFSGELHVLGEKILASQTSRVRALGTGLIPEDRLEQGLWLEESCFINMAIGVEDRFLKRQIFDFKKLTETAAEWAKDFDVRASSLEVPVGSLSGGNQQKVIFAREVGGRDPRLLICHQPTRGVDLGAIDLIHRKILELRNRGVGILVISSELDELLKICDRLYVLFEGRVAAQLSRADFAKQRIGQFMTGAPDAN